MRALAYRLCVALALVAGLGMALAIPSHLLLGALSAREASAVTLISFQASMFFFFFMRRIYLWSLK